MDLSPPGLAREYLSHPAFDNAVARLGTWVLTAARFRPVYDELTGRGVHVTQAFGMSEGLFLFTPARCSSACGPRPSVSRSRP